MLQNSESLKSGNSCNQRDGHAVTRGDQLDELGIELLFIELRVRIKLALTVTVKSG